MSTAASTDIELEAQILSLQGLEARTRIRAEIDMTPKQWVSLLRASKRATAAHDCFIAQFAATREVGEADEEEPE